MTPFAVTSRSANGSVCPICAGPGRGSMRYPAALCEACHKSIRDRDGQAVEMFNESLSGGLKISTANGALTSGSGEAASLRKGGRMPSPRTSVRRRRSAASERPGTQGEAGGDDLKGIEGEQFAAQKRDRWSVPRFV